MNAAWKNTAALAAIAVAIALLVAKNMDRSPSNRRLNVSALFGVSPHPGANP
jgi:hypothetical protein